MTVATKKEIFLHGKDRDFTAEEWEELSEQIGQAFRRGDLEEVRRIGKMVPADPITAKALKNAFGKDWVIEKGFDLTEANRKWGEGWLDGPEDQ